MCVNQLLLLLLLDELLLLYHCKKSEWIFFSASPVIFAHQGLYYLFAREPGMDWLIVAVLCLLSAGLILSGYILVVLILPLWNAIENLIFSILSKTRFFSSPGNKGQEENDSASMNGHVSESQMNKKLAQEQSGSSQRIWLMKFSVWGILTVTSFLSCGGLTIVILFLLHFKILKDILRNNGTVFTLRRQDVLFLEIHLLAVIFSSPSLIVWFKGLSYGTLSLNPDPSHLSAMFMSSISCFPLPRHLVQYKYVLLIPLAILARISQNFIPILSGCLAITVGLYLNKALNLTLFKRHDLEKKKFE